MSIRVGLRHFARMLKAVVVGPPPMEECWIAEGWGYETGEYYKCWGDDWNYVEPPTMELCFSEAWSG